MDKEKEAKVLAEYLSKVFTPIKLTIKAEQWKQLNYKNKLFHVSSYPDDNMLNYVSQDYRGIKFNYALLNSFEFFNQPYILMAFLIAGNNYIRDFFKMDIFNSDNQILLSLDTEGKLPNRWIRMINDFAFNGKGEIQEGETNQEFWETHCKNLPVTALESLNTIAMKMMNDSYNITVIKSPDYSGKLDEKLDNTETEEIKNRIWYTKDCKFSKPVELFFKSTSKLYSYNLNENSFYPLAACEGGIFLSDYMKGPWHQYKRKTMFISIYSRLYAEIKGQNKYGTNNDVSIEEIIILEEALKHAGAEIECKSLHQQNKNQDCVIM